MNWVLQNSSARVSHHTGLFTAVLVIILVSVAGARSQRAAPHDNVLPPPKSNLVPLHWPDLTTLEADVRDQLISAQNALTATANERDPGPADAALSEAYGALGEIYQAYSLTSPARECYLNASRLTPKDFRWVYLLGKIDQQEGQVDEAIRHYRIARALRPEYVAVPVNLGNIYLQLNRLEDAQENFRAALIIDEASAAATYGLGQLALSQRSYAEAVHYFEKALALSGGANRIHYSLAMAYRGLGDAEKARAHLAQQGPVGVRVADPLVDGLGELIAGERVHLIRGRLAIEAKRYAEAADELRKAIVARPDSLSAHLNLGAVLIQTGDLPAATSQFEESLRIDPNNAIAHYNLAILLANKDRHERAITHLRSLLSIYSNDLAGRFLLARELRKSGRSEEALVEFSRVVAADPNNEEALLEEVKLLLLKSITSRRRSAWKKATRSIRKKARRQSCWPISSLLHRSTIYATALGRSNSRNLSMKQRA